MNSNLTFEVLPGLLGISKLDATHAIPDWAVLGSFFSVCKTFDDLSLVCEQRNIPDHVKSERNWRALKIEGPLDFALTGVLASVSQTLAQSGISIFAISTFDTDYVLVKLDLLPQAISALQAAGHRVYGDEMPIAGQDSKPASATSATHERPEFIRHWKPLQEEDNSSYPGSSEKHSIGSPLGRKLGLTQLGIHHEELLPGRRTSPPTQMFDEHDGKPTPGL